jgi:hypothetical protein
MNERIKELAEQAGAVFTDSHAASLLDGEIERFAALIVRECAEVAANTVWEAEGVDFGLVEECYKHFGVKE